MPFLETMALRTIIKVGEITNLSEARYCAGMGVEMLGFPLDENHPRYVELTKVKEITGWLSGVKVVGEFTGNHAANIEFLAESIDLDFIQVDYPISFEALNHLQLPVILRINTDLFSTDEIDTCLKGHAHAHGIEYFLLDSETKTDLSGWEASIKKWASEYPILVGFGITPETVDDILSTIKPAGLSLKGEDEIRPGLKKFDELADILELLED